MRHFIGDKVFSTCVMPGCQGRVTVDGMACYEHRMGTLIQEESRGGQSLGWILAMIPTITLIACIFYSYKPSWFN